MPSAVSARITETGSISFVLNYHNDGKERRYTIGRHPEFARHPAARAGAKKPADRKLRTGMIPWQDRQQLKRSRHCGAWRMRT